MSDLSARIAQFENMTAADPDNEMAHFSLGRAYAEDGRHAEAAKSLERCVQLNPEMSKAYELCGRAMIEAGWADKAVDILMTGHGVAASKGDRMPMEAMAELLRSIGREPPRSSEAALREAQAAADDGTFVCRRTGKRGHQLEKPPFRGRLGQWIHENISEETWNDWIGQGTKVINELRLDFSRDQDQETYDRYMKEYLGYEEAVEAE